MAAPAGTQWQLRGDYFENCNCDVVCPCLFSPNAPMTSKPTEGHCDVAFGFHIDQGSYGDVRLDGLNAAIIGQSPGPMAEGNLAVALYVDERGNEQQREALQAVLSGGAGGPMAVLAPLIGKMLGVKAVPITYQVEGRGRSMEIPNVMRLSVRGLDSLNPESEIWAQTGHPFAPERLALAVGNAGSTVEDFGLRFDNSGKNGHYAPITWSGN
jgi:hypothetical protein